MPKVQVQCKDDGTTCDAPDIAGWEAVGQDCLWEDDMRLLNPFRAHYGYKTIEEAWPIDKPGRDGAKAQYTGRPIHQVNDIDPWCVAYRPIPEALPDGATILDANWIEVTGSYTPVERGDLVIYGDGHPDKFVANGGRSFEIDDQHYNPAHRCANWGHGYRSYRLRAHGQVPAARPPRRLPGNPYHAQPLPLP